MPQDDYLGSRLEPPTSRARQRFKKTPISAKSQVLVDPDYKPPSAGTQPPRFIPRQVARRGAGPDSRNDPHSRVNEDLKSLALHVCGSVPQGPELPAGFTRPESGSNRSLDRTKIAIRNKLKQVGVFFIRPVIDIGSCRFMLFGL